MTSRDTEKQGEKQNLINADVIDPDVVPFSKIGEPPESFTLLETLPSKTLLVIISVTISIVFLLLSPIILLCSIIQNWYASTLKYHTDPSKLRVAIIGGGWSGLQCMTRLQELGVNKISGFERYDGVGGTFHSKLAYQSLQIHGALWLTAFKDYPHSKDEDINDGKISGKKIHDYINRYGIEKKLLDNYQFNSRVAEIQYSSKDLTATLVIENNEGDCRIEGPFDSVIFTSLASEPNMPHIDNEEKYQGLKCHSQGFKHDVFRDIVENDKKVVIVGGSKSACDHALCLVRAGYDNFVWLCRKPYIFWKYELMFHQRQLVNRVRGLTTIFALIVSLVSENVGGFIMWANGMAVTFGQRHNNWRKFHFGILCPTQRCDLAKIPKEKIVDGYPIKFTEDSLEISVNGSGNTSIPADVVLFATGCQSGIDKISMKKDGEDYIFDQNMKFLDNFIVPDFPVLSNATQLFTTFGPLRAVNAADMTVFHHCVRSPLTEHEMKLMSSKQSRSANANSDFLFNSKSSFINTFVSLHIDLILRGHVNVLDFLRHVYEIFCCAKQNALRMNNLPKK